MEIMWSVSTVGLQSVTGNMRMTLLQNTFTGHLHVNLPRLSNDRMKSRYIILNCTHTCIIITARKVYSTFWVQYKWELKCVMYFSCFYHTLQWEGWVRFLKMFMPWKLYCDKDTTYQAANVKLQKGFLFKCY